MRRLRRAVWHPATKGALTHISVLGITTTGIAAIHQALPAVSQVALYYGWLFLTAAGFVGLYFTINLQPPPRDDD